MEKIRNPKGAGRKPSEAGVLKENFTHRVSGNLVKEWKEKTSNKVVALENAMRDYLEFLPTKMDAAYHLIRATQKEDFNEGEAIASNMNGIPGMAWLKAVNRKKWDKNIQLDIEQQADDLAQMLTAKEVKQILEYYQ